MPSIDCDMNPTAVGNDPEKAGRTGLVYLIIAFFFFFLTFIRIGKMKPAEKNEIAPVIEKRD